MRARIVTTCLMGAALLLGGCEKGFTEGEDVGRMKPTVQGTAPMAQMPISSITCSSHRPVGTFSYSSNHARLADLAAVIGEEVGLAGTFSDVDANELGVLMENRFIDPRGNTNGSPTMWEFHQFLCSHPEVRAIGFTANMGSAGVQGSEAIASLETVYADAISESLRRDAHAFCATAPEKTMRTHLECFWD